MTEKVQGNIIHNVPVYTPGAKFAQKPKIIETLDFSKIRYAGADVNPTPTPEPTKQTVGFFSKVKNTIKNAGKKIGNGMKSVGTKLTKTKGGKTAMIGIGIGALLIGGGILLSKLLGGDDKAEDPNKAEKPTNPNKPENPAKPTDPENPAKPTDPENPTKPTDPENPAKPTDPENPAKPTDPENPAKPTDPENPTKPTDPENPAKPTNPENPTKPTNPENPAKPTDPEKPGIIPALPGEEVDGSWASADGHKMVCSDASGRTKNIQGKLKIDNDKQYEKNPNEFTITDKSSGNAHEYRFKKVGVNDEGQPIYKCISMNDRKVITDNQYTLKWEDDKTPTLVQEEHQNNYGTGLKFGKATRKKRTQAPAEEEKQAKPVEEEKKPAEEEKNEVV